MSGHLPGGCSDFDLDMAAGGYDLPEWTCPNLDCGEKWRETPELWACEYEHCDVSTCPTCESVCFSCAKHLCANHYTIAHCGDGIKRYCQACLEDFVENNPELVGGFYQRAS